MLPSTSPLINCCRKISIDRAGSCSAQQNGTRRCRSGEDGPESGGHYFLAGSAALETSTAGAGSTGLEASVAFAASAAFGGSVSGADAAAAGVTTSSGSHLPLFTT